MSKKNVFSTANKHIKISRKLHLSSTRKAVVLLAIMGIVLYTILFSTYPQVHDYFHELRHGLMVIPCH